MGKVGKPVIADIAIVGMGLAGLSAAYYFSAHTPYDVVVIDGNKRIPADNRTTAVLYKNRDFFSHADAWNLMSEESAPIKEVILHDDISGKDAAPARFYASEIGCPYFSLNIPNTVLHDYLTRITGRGKIRPVIIKSSVTGTDVVPGYRRLYMQDGTVVTAKLIIAADGAGSFLRRHEKINIEEKPYGQTALIGFAEHTQKHLFRAGEFYGDGRLLTFVPTSDERRSAIVWCGESAGMDKIRNKSSVDICKEMFSRSLGIYGEVKTFSVDGAFPIVHRLADYYKAERMALIGETIHTVHPLGAQGYNLSLSDIKILADKVIKYGYAGLDIGSDAMLKEYESSRKKDLLSRSGVLHGLATQITEQGIVKRRLHGKILATVDKNRLLKNTAMRYMAAG